MPNALILWDIDHTLIETGGVGTEVFAAAFSAATGVALQEMPDPTGKLEPDTFMAACEANGAVQSPQAFARFEVAQAAEYRARAEDLMKRGRVLPGVTAILAKLADNDDVAQAVLTGNTLAAAEAKLEAFGLQQYIDFACSAGGTDAQSRPDLVAVTWERARVHHQRTFGMTNTVIIGDTYADIETGHRNNCRVVAVATGVTGAEELTAAGADAVFQDLSDQEAVLEAILGPLA